MNVIGKTADGKMTIVVIENSELESLNLAVARLAAIRGILCGAAISELTELPGKEIQSVKIRPKRWIRQIRSMPAARPLEKGKNLCERCQKVEVHGKAKYCKACNMARAREYARDHWRKLHPAAKTRPAVRIPAPHVVAKSDRLDLIRQANDRVNKLREEEAG